MLSNTKFLENVYITSPYGKSGGSIEGLKFHSDWNWTMACVTYITDKENYLISIHECSCKIGKLRFNEDRELIHDFIIDECDYSTLGAVFKAVSSFAKLYNEGKLFKNENNK